MSRVLLRIVTWDRDREEATGVVSDLTQETPLRRGLPLDRFGPAPQYPSPPAPPGMDCAAIDVSEEMIATVSSVYFLRIGSNFLFKDPKF